MRNINKQALRQLAEKAGSEEWQSRKEPGVGGEYTVIVKGSLKKHQGWSTCRPVADQVVDKKTMDFISAANPAAVLALLDEQEAAEKRIAELEEREVVFPSFPEANDWLLRMNMQAVREMDVEALRGAGIKIKGE